VDVEEAGLFQVQQRNWNILERELVERCYYYTTGEKKHTHTQQSRIIKRVLAKKIENGYFYFKRERVA